MISEKSKELDIDVRVPCDDVMVRDPCSAVVCLYLPLLPPPTPGPIYCEVCKHLIIFSSIFSRLELGVYT